MKENPRHKTALITGGSGGIGMAIAKKFVSNNIHILLIDTTEPAKDSFPFFQCDLRKPEQIDRLFNWVKQEMEMPDILVLNAGVGIKEKLSEGDPEKWQQVVDVNIMGHLRCIRAFVPQMLERGNGHVIFVSSVASNQPHIYGGVYSATKTALDMIAETLRLETLPHLKVTVISPGAIETDFFKHQLAGFSDADLEMPMMDPKEVAEDVFYAISKEGKGVINRIITRSIEQQF